MKDVTRRDFLKRGGVLLGTGLAVPAWLRTLQASVPGSGSEKILVLVNLAGGNDGLNTVVPFADDIYQKSRPTLAFHKDALHSLNETVGLHPSLKRLKGIYDEGQLAVVQSVGYPGMNRSHFRATEIYETAEPDSYLEEGWAGRLLDLHPGKAGQILSCRLGNPSPLALRGKKNGSLTIRGLNGLNLLTDDRHKGDRKNMLRAFDEIFSQKPPYPLARAFRDTVRSARAMGKELKEASKSYAAEGYPNSGLANNLKLIAQMIHNGFGPRVYYVALGGFDTHANQKDRHAQLLKQWSEGLAAFQKDLQAHGNADRVLTLTYSEFGRRLKENGSKGTDHGTTLPMFLMGEGVRGGLYGANPDLTDLEGGDPKHDIDFRRVYAAILQGWWSQEAAPVLGESYSPLALFPGLAREGEKAGRVVETSGQRE